MTPCLRSFENAYEEPEVRMILHRQLRLCSVERTSADKLHDSIHHSMHEWLPHLRLEMPPKLMHMDATLMQDVLQEEIDPDANPEDNVEILEGEGVSDAAQADRPRITTRYMTKYEKARVLGTRALQIRYDRFGEGLYRSGMIELCLW